jgi:hypothetical protein
MTHSEPSPARWHPICQAIQFVVALLRNDWLRGSVTELSEQACTMSPHQTLDRSGSLSSGGMGHPRHAPYDPSSGEASFFLRTHYSGVYAVKPGRGWGKTWQSFRRLLSAVTRRSPVRPDDGIDSGLLGQNAARRLITNRRSPKYILRRRSMGRGPDGPAESAFPCISSGHFERFRTSGPPKRRFRSGTASFCRTEMVATKA